MPGTRETTKLIVILLCIVVLSVRGCTPKAPEVSGIEKIEILFSPDHDIKGEIADPDDLEYIAEVLNALEPSEPSNCVFEDLIATVYLDDDTFYVYDIAIDGCSEIRLGTDQNNIKQFTFAKGHFRRFKQIVADALLKTEQYPYLEKWKEHTYSGYD